MATQHPNLTDTADCTARPQFPTPAKKVGYSVKQITFEDDTTVTVVGSTTKHRKWRLTYDAQQASEKSSFEAFHDARLGGRDSFYFDDPITGETDILVKFTTDDIEYVPTTVRTWSWTATIFSVPS